MLAIDRFKSINDTFDHAAGDAVLHAVRPVCRSGLRLEDQIARRKAAGTAPS